MNKNLSKFIITIIVVAFLNIAQHGSAQEQEFNSFFPCSNQLSYCPAIQPIVKISIFLCALCVLSGSKRTLQFCAVDTRKNFDRINMMDMI